MGKKRLSKQHIQAILAYSLSAVLSIVIITWVLKLWRTSLDIPLAYYVDSIFSGTLVKGIIENGWYLHNPSLGVPGGMFLHDYPGSDTFLYLIIKLVTIFVPRYPEALNVYYLIKFPLTALISLSVFRYFRFSYPVAITASLFYAFIPFHLFRGQGHLFLASYYLIPLVILVVIWVFEGVVNLINRTENNFSINVKDKKIILSIIIVVLIASSGLYYAFFTVIFISLAAIFSGLAKRQFLPVFNAAILIFIIGATVAFNMLPSFIYRHSNGPNPQAITRISSESEIYGMKISQLLLPITDHRIKNFAIMKESYNKYAPMVNENQDSTLGFIPGFGFLFLIAWLMFGHSLFTKILPDERSQLLGYLSKLNILAVLIGTIGGFGSIIAFTVAPQIRAYNRISIFIAFFAVTALFILIDSLSKRYATNNIAKAISYVLLICIFGVGLLDQTTNRMVPEYALLKQDFLSDKQFMSKIEKTVPANSSIFQLPFWPFPEMPPLNQMNDYDLFRGYLHSKKLKWSYGAIKGRPTALWQDKLSKKPLDQIITDISVAGFNGIYIDRFAYADRASDLENKIYNIIKVKPIASINGRLSFFDLTKFNKRSRQKHNKQEWQKLRREALAGLPIKN